MAGFVMGHRSKLEVKLHQHRCSFCKKLFRCPEPAVNGAVDCRWYRATARYCPRCMP